MGNFIDTADTYTRWVAGHVGGESEAILGRWMKARGTRDAVVLATKVGKKPDRRGLSAANIRTAAEESLTRLGTGYIDLYYAHADDPDMPLEEALGAFDALIREGKVRHVAASNCCNSPSCACPPTNSHCSTRYRAKRGIGLDAVSA